jgi:dephospho-CoA kinase
MRRLIGLTGNLASGKSTVAKILSELGVPTIDADAVSREVTKKGSSVLADIAKAFGANVLTSSGELDRTALREIVFKDASKRKRLEALLHPLIKKRSDELVEAFFESGCDIVVYEAALLYEAGRDKDFDGILVVLAPTDQQIERLRKRDPSLSEQTASQILGAQLSQEKKATRARWTINNDGTLDDLRQKIQHWLQQLRSEG